MITKRGLIRSAALAAPALILPRRKLIAAPGLIAYPAGVQAGFNPNHIAAQSTRFSAAAISKFCVNLLTGAPPTSAPGGPALLFDGIIGPCVKGIGAGSAQIFGNLPAVSDTLVTFAAIVRPASIGGTYGILATTITTPGGIQFGVINASGLWFSYGAVGAATVASALPVTLGVPYFIAMSGAIGANMNLVSTRLDTGNIATNTHVAPASYSAAGHTSWQLGNIANGQGFIGAIAAAMYSNTLLGLSELQYWAQDPWSFWYPDK